MRRKHDHEVDLSDDRVLSSAWDSDNEQNIDSSSSDFEPSQKAKRKVGRPIAYQGDPDSPQLTEPERRRIKRRIANRESARRVRHRRQLTMQELQAKIKSLDKHNAALLDRVNGMGKLRTHLEAELTDLQAKLHQEHASGRMLHCELTKMRKLQMQTQLASQGLQPSFRGQIQSQNPCDPRLHTSEQTHSSRAGNQAWQQGQR